MTTRPATGPDLDEVAAGFADTDETRRVQRGYLRWFAGAARVLDVGCGCGVFLDLLRDAGVDAVGVDASAAAGDACRARGHTVRVGDALDVLDGLAAHADRFDGVFVSHLIEHFVPADAARLFAAIAAIVAPGGKVVVVTPNVKNLVVLGEVFWLDPTHVRPYPRALIERFGAAVGLGTVASFDDPATNVRRAGIRRVLARLRSRLSGADRSGPMDAVVVLSP